MAQKQNFKAYLWFWLLSKSEAGSCHYLLLLLLFALLPVISLFKAANLSTLSYSFSSVIMAL